MLEIALQKPEFILNAEVKQDLIYGVQYQESQDRPSPQLHAQENKIQSPHDITVPAPPP